MTNKKLSNTVYLVSLAMLAAIIIMLTFTGLGYIPLGVGFTISILTLPVTIGAVVLGPMAGAILGLVFGITSFLTCILGMDALGALLLTISPLKLLIMCIVPRVITGLLCGYIFKGLQKIDKTKIISFAVSSLACPLMNTLFFLSTLWLFFGNDPAVTQYTNGSTSIFVIIFALGGINAIIEAAAGLILGTAITKSLSSAIKRIH